MGIAFRRVRSWTERHNHLTALIFFSLLIGSIYFPVLIGHASLKTYGPWPLGPLFVGDPIAGGPITYPMEQLVARAWASLQLPLWNPYQAYGLTLGGNQGVAWFIPEIIVHLVFPHNFSIWNVLRLVLIAQGAYFLARELERSFTAAVLVGLFYGLAGPALPNVNLGMDNTLLVFPYLLIALRRMALAESVSDAVLWVALSALAVDFSFLAGFAEVLPLQFLFALFFTLSLVPFRTGGIRRVIYVAARGCASVFLGVLGSWISIYTLILPLKSYFSYQSVTSYLAHAPITWLATLVDPSLFGQAVTAGRFTNGQTVWVLGNPVWAFLLALSALLLMRRVLRKTRPPLWLFVGMLTVAVGVLGYADLLGILGIFSLPPFNLIIMVRFLEFAWWLPSCLIVGWAYDNINDVGSAAHIAIVALLGLLLGATAILLGLITAQTRVLGGLPSEDVVFALVFFGLLFVVIVARGRSLQAGLLVLSLLSLVIFVPKNYFPGGLPSQPAQAMQSVTAGNSDVLFFPNNDVSSVLLSGAGVHLISAFGPFYPRGYSDLVTGLFPSPDPTSPGGVLWAADITLAPLGVTEENLVRLRALGVTGIANFGPLQFTPAQDPSFLQAIHALKGTRRPSYVAAINALAGVYLSRPDLQSAFPYTSTTLNQELIGWAVAYGTRTDSARATLSPFRNQYKALSAIVSKNSLPPIVSPQQPLLLGAPSVTSTTNGEMYVYPLKGSQGLVLAPRQVTSGVSQPAFASLLRRDPAQLLRTAFVLRSEPSVDPSTVHHSLQGLRVAQLSYSPGFDQQTLKVRAHGHGLLVLRIQFTRHAVVTVNGSTVHPVPVDGVYTGVYVRKGISTIRFNYVTPTVFWSTLISAFVTLALMVVAVASIWRRKLQARVTHAM